MHTGRFSNRFLPHFAQRLQGRARGERALPPEQLLRLVEPAKHRTSARLATVADLSEPFQVLDRDDRGFGTTA
ncbi:MAG TPA: hypothetical protein VL403_12995 [Candidatus Kryptonia bacterium]|nr:hypothetical protein [Candidatus Kryptonia bacterium]